MHTFSHTALEVLNRRYLKDGETPEKMFERVAYAVAEAEANFVTGAIDTVTNEANLAINHWAEKFYQIMFAGDFLPNSPTLINAGKELGQLSACFVLPIEDNTPSIFDAIKYTAMIHKSGGGTGFSFSRLRPKNDIVRVTRGVSSGPVSFMTVFNAATEVIKQGGVRRGANMAVLHCSHPDILEFVTCKHNSDNHNNFNLSVGATNKFMYAIEHNLKWDLVNPRSKEIVQQIAATELFDSIAKQAWEHGDPGILFLDEMNHYNPTPYLGEYECTNPCVTGDTLVAVADGRNAISIKQLAKEKKDVPVHCIDPTTGKVSVMMGRNPRLTRKKQEIYLVEFTDGSSIKVTKDHKFLTFNRCTKKTKDLVPGDRLSGFTKYEAPNTTTDKKYWYVINHEKNRPMLPEHQMIMGLYEKRPSERHVIHHKDNDGLNNKPNNIMWITASDHNVIESRIHSMAGVNNPRFGVILTEEIRKKISEGVKRHHINNPDTRLKISEKVKEYYKNNGTSQLKVEKVGRRMYYCPICKKKLRITETKFANYTKFNRACSIACSNKRRWSIKPPVHVYAKEEAIFHGTNFYNEFEELPTVHKWDKYSSRKKIPSREVIRRMFGGLKNFRSKILATGTNHTVKRITVLTGLEDVYNITVDKFHTVAYITNESKTRRGNKKLSGIYTRQCGEQMLLPWESCNLGSINLANFIKDNNSFDLYRLGQIVKLAVRFLDNVITINKFPLEKIKETTLRTRKIGLGIMGWADALAMMDIPYDSKTAFSLAQEVMGNIQKVAKTVSQDLGIERGSYPANQNLSEARRTMRNATVTTIAPTGTLSIIAGCSSGIEPFFALAYKRNILDGDSFYEINPVVEKKFSESQDWDGIRKYILENGTLNGCRHVSGADQEIFKTAHEIHYSDHIRMQAAFQGNVDNAVSKTINMPQDATVDDIKEAYLSAWRMKCKGITIYRDCSRNAQVLEVGHGDKKMVDMSPTIEHATLTPQKRPNKLTGQTCKIETSCGTMYITINFNNDIPFEVFTMIGKAGGCASSQSEALGRLISLCLRAGIAPQHVVKQIRGITCHLPYGLGPKKVSSCPDAVAQALENILNLDKVENKTRPNGRGACPDCGSPLESGGGCASCTSCGYSDCG